MHLLDVNVLIALLDANHAQHEVATVFFAAVHRDGWATCALTENGLLRILGHPAYPNGLGSPQRSRVLLAGLTAMPGHQFWPDELSLLDQRRFPDLPASGQLTDIYLLGLAVSRQAWFASFDRRIDPSLVADGERYFRLLT